MSDPNPAAPQPKWLILDIYGKFIQRMGSWIAISDLIELMAPLGVGEQAVRSSISRMKQRGLLEAADRDRRVGYQPTPEGTAVLEAGDVRLFTPRQPADLREGWVLATFSVPESRRRDRHAIRSRLGWLGFGNPAPGVWIAPARLLAEVKSLLERRGLDHYVDLYLADHQGFGDLPELVQRAWDLDALTAMYRRLIDDQQPVLDRWEAGGRTDEDAFIDLVFAIEQWRKLPYLDPGLPSDLLPPDWAGSAARELFFRLAAALEPYAFRHVGGVLHT